MTVSVLKLPGEGTCQDTGKNSITTTVAIRLILDRVANVDEAINLLSQYDMHSSMSDANFHFLIADMEKTVAVEYCNNEMSVLDEYYLTTFYIDPRMDKFGRGYERYDILSSVLNFKKDTLTIKESMNLLDFVSQEESEESTSMTQWSAVYDMTNLKLYLAIFRNFDKIFTFEL